MASFSALLGLCKLRVVALIVLTAVVGMLLAVPDFPGVWRIFKAAAGIGFSAASAAVFNHIIDERCDRMMARTKNRPLPQQKIKRGAAFVWGFALGFFGLGILYFFVNALTAALTFLSLIGYAVFYTVYLKHKTPQNIVIGGVAGAMPPVLGWAAMSGGVSADALLLFLIIFIWTPPHFWALAIHRYEDYKSAEIPMLPVTHGIAFTRLQILLYTVLLLVVSLLPFLTQMSGIIYLIFALVLGAIFLYYAVRIMQKPADKKTTLATFSYSVQYLALLFAGLVIDHYFEI